MRLLIMAFLVVVTMTTGSHAQPAATAQLAESYKSVYEGDDATGKHVIALWQFEADEPGKDASGNGHDAQLVGAEITPEGKFGSALECFPGWPVEDKPHRAVVKLNPALTPKGAFTVEMWICPKKEMEGYPESFLLDSRYVDQTGMQLILSGESGGKRNVRMMLGFGDSVATYGSTMFACPTGEWRHIAFTYDGAGTGSFFIDGAAAGRLTEPGRGSIVAAKQSLVIGDRVGSYYHGFPGYIDQVRVCQGVLEFRAAGFSAPPQRKVFLRMEPTAKLRFDVTNRLRAPVSGARTTFDLGGAGAVVVDLPELAPGVPHRLEYDLDTSLRPDEYNLRATIELPGDPPYRSSEQFPVTIVPRELPHKMPVLMWGAGLDEVDRLKDLGFTHAIGVPADFDAIWKAGEPIPAQTPERTTAMIQSLDYALANGVRGVAGLSPGSWARSKEEFRRVDREGKPYSGEGDICARFEGLQDFCHNVGASVAQTYGDHPGFQTALVHTEVRGATRLCFHDHDKAAFREFAGYDIPAQAKSHAGVAHTEIADFPHDRVIPDDYPLLKFYKWFWKEGDGWNALHTAVHEGIKSTGREDLWTFHDPAARCLSVYGSGGDVDYLSHWTYSYPDPIRIGLCTDELFCMAGGAARKDQQVMKMTQIIWYRSQTAPEPGEEARAQTADFQDQDTRPQGTGTVDESGRYVAAWERDLPDSRFITIAPMHLREALWTKIARPIQGIMYHGWQSLVQVGDNTGGYRYTHPETKNELRRLVKTVVEPLGPTLVQVPDMKSDVAFLESFSSQIFARRGTWGWNGGWAGDAYLILHYAGLQPRVIYDETVQQEGLDAFKVLVAVDCDVLPQSVAEKIKDFQARGGIVIGDEHLCPAIVPDILLQSYTRPKEADMARANMMEAAENLCADLDAHYSRYATSSDRSVIQRVRQYGTCDYLFAINDLREFGDYVGHHALVMENGLPAEADLTVNRQGGYVYDVLENRLVGQFPADAPVKVHVNLAPCDGRLLMVTQRPIQGIEVTAPETVTVGQELQINVDVLDDRGVPINAVVPVRVDILDPHGRPAEFSGFYGARDGRLVVTARLAPNDVQGLWQVRVRDLASGATSSAYVRVRGV